MRNAAVQTLAKGRGTESALSFVREARAHDGLFYQSDTTERSEEIKRKILQRKGTALAAKDDDESTLGPMNDRTRKAIQRFTARLDNLDNL